MTHMSVLMCYALTIVAIAWIEKHARELHIWACYCVVHWELLLLRELTHMSVLLCWIVHIAWIETLPWITHMSVPMCCALRIAWIVTHTPVNYTHECATVLCTENCRYYVNWHTHPWITHMSMLLCCALIIVAIAWIEKHSVNWHTCNAYCKSLSIHEKPGFLRRIRDPGIRLKTRENREGWQGVLTAQNCRKWFHNSVKRCHNSGFFFCGKKEYLWQTLTNGENIGTFPQNDARSGNRHSGVQIGSESEQNSWKPGILKQNPGTRD